MIEGWAQDRSKVECCCFDDDTEVPRTDSTLVFRGLVFAALPSVLLWWGIIAAVRAIA